MNISPVKKTWSTIDVTAFGPYQEALQARLLDLIWNDEAIKEEILTNPKAVFERETGMTFPDKEVKVLEEGTDTFYFVLPKIPPMSEMWYRYEQIAGWWMLSHTMWWLMYRIGDPDKARFWREFLQAQIIGRSWNDAEFRNGMLTNPKETLENEAGIKFPPTMQVKALEENDNLVYFVIPKNPKLEKLDEKLEYLGEWWAMSHTWWWWLVSLRLQTPATNAVTEMVD